MPLDSAESPFYLTVMSDLRNPSQNATLERAISELMGRLQQLRHARGEVQRRVEDIDDEARKVIQAIESVIDLFPDTAKKEYGNKIEKLREDFQERKGIARDDYVEIRQAIGSLQEGEFSREDIQSHLVKNGIYPDRKRIYNVLNYLVSKGLLKRVSRGRYLYQGMLIETSDELGGEERIEDE